MDELERVKAEIPEILTTHGPTRSGGDFTVSQARASARSRWPR